jgi:hypothetical protein
MKSVDDVVWTKWHPKTPKDTPKNIFWGHVHFLHHLKVFGQILKLPYFDYFFTDITIIHHCDIYIHM